MAATPVLGTGVGRRKGSSPFFGNMVDAKELKKIAGEKQELDFLVNYNDCVHRLEEITKRNAESGYTEITLERFYRSAKHTYTIDGQNFFIDRETYKKLKKLYKENGFKVKKFWKFITISWW